MIPADDCLYATAVGTCPLHVCCLQVMPFLVQDSCCFQWCEDCGAAIQDTNMRQHACIICISLCSFDLYNNSAISDLL